jgi:hypothetical protein
MTRNGIHGAARSLAFATGMLLATGVHAEGGPTFDFPLAEMPSEFGKYEVKHDAAGDYLLTGIARSDAAARARTFLAVSPVDPVPATKSAAASAFFRGEPRRPATWSEAEAECQAFHAAGKTWTLPTKSDMRWLNHALDFAGKILDATSGPELAIAGSYRRLEPERRDQFRFFWLADDADQASPAGLKWAGSFGRDAVAQKQTTTRLLHVVCVTRFTAPDPEFAANTAPTPGE